MTQWRGEPRGDTGKDVPGTEATHAKPGSGSDLGFKEEQKAEGARGEPQETKTWRNQLQSHHRGSCRLEQIIWILFRK